MVLLIHVHVQAQKMCVWDGAVKMVVCVLVNGKNQCVDVQYSIVEKTVKRVGTKFVNIIMDTQQSKAKQKDGKVEP